jgi:hypothetical protein
MTRAASNGRPAKFDLDAAAAAAAEGDGAAPFEFTFRGGSYKLPPVSRWPLRAQHLLLSAFEESEPVPGESPEEAEARTTAAGLAAAAALEKALRLLLGPDQTEQLYDAGITAADLGVLFEAAAAAAGLGNLPNSSAPSPPASTRT